MWSIVALGMATRNGFTALPWANPRSTRRAPSAISAARRDGRFALIEYRLYSFVRTDSVRLKPADSVKPHRTLGEVSATLALGLLKRYTFGRLQWTAWRAVKRNSEAGK